MVFDKVIDVRAVTASLKQTFERLAKLLADGVGGLVPCRGP